MVKYYIFLFKIITLLEYVLFSIETQLKTDFMLVKSIAASGL